MIVFNHPNAWCDGACERCPVAPTCPVRKKQLQREWVHHAKHEDPNDMEVVAQDLMKDLESTQRMLEDYAREEGIDLDAPLPNEPVVLEAARLERASRDLVGAIARARREEHDLSGLTLFHAKCARVAMHLGDRDTETWTLDAVPNLLLIEHLRRELQPVLESMGEDVLRAAEKLDRILRPHFDAITEDERRALADMIARSEAPSPFCKTG